MTAALVAALKRQSPTAFEQLIAEYGTMLYRVALRLMDQPEEAEEVLQETLLTVYEKIHTFDERSALTTWLYPHHGQYSAHATARQGTYA
jgi:RNA polymerase sigma-70 factor (ECF subfamily)